MTPELLVWAAGPTAGALVGAFAGSLATAWTRSRPAEVADEEPSRLRDMKEADREALASELRVHAAAAARQVATLADELAGGDVALRERLRLLEGNGPLGWWS